MDMKERIDTILNENHLTQMEMGELIGVTNSYISALKCGRNKSISWVVANAIEEHLGYSAQWVKTGKEPKYAPGNEKNITELQKKLIGRVQVMPDYQVQAVLSFLDALENPADGQKLEY